MIYSKEVEEMCVVARDGNHGCAPIPEEAKWVKAKEVKDISGFTHGVGWCAPQQGACKLSLNIKEGIIQEALVETIGCSGMTHSAAMAAELLPGRTVLEALNTDLVCDAINTAMRELFLQIVYGRSQSAFSEEGLPVGAGLEDLGKGLRSQVKNSLVSSGCIINGTVEDSILFKQVFVGNNCYIKNSIILNDVYLGDNTHIENCIVESRDTIRANSYHVGENGIKIVVEKNERYVL